MKKLIVIVFLSLFINLNAQTSEVESFELSESIKQYYVGEWIGEDKGAIGSMKFDAEGYVSFTVQGETFGGKNFVRNGKEGSAYFFIDDNLNPVQIDIIVRNLVSMKDDRMFGLISNKDADSFILALGFDGNRPAEINEENSILFKRVIE